MEWEFKSEVNFHYSLRPGEAGSKPALKYASQDMWLLLADSDPRDGQEFCGNEGTGGL